MKTIFVSGCFDVLHRGHIKLFEYCKEIGDILIVGVDSDAKVLLDKGHGRPVNSLEDRMFLLTSISFINEVKSFNSPKGLENLIKQIAPDKLVVGSDWKGKIIIGSKYAKKIIYFPRLIEYSTTKTILAINNLE